MDSEKNENNNIDSGYGSLPQDVVKALMASHPLRGGDRDVDEFPTSATASREEIRAARRKRLEKARVEESSKLAHGQEPYNEPEEMAKMPKEDIQEDSGYDYGQNIAPVFDDDDEEMVQLVRHKSRSRGFKKAAPAPAPVIEDTDEQERGMSEERPQRKRASKPAKREKAARPPKKVFRDDDYEEEYFEINSPEDSKRALDSFFANNDNSAYEYEERKVHNFNIVLIGAAVFVVIFVALIILNVSTSGKLAEANEKIAALEEVQAQNEELKLSILSLEEELNGLRSGDTGELNVDEVGDTPSEGEAAPTTPPAETTPALTGEFDTYTVKDGDSFWSIAAEVYGNGAEYQRILDANYLTENSPIKAGETLKIPK